jgi:hypothetical protein
MVYSPQVMLRLQVRYRETISLCIANESFGGYIFILSKAFFARLVFDSLPRPILNLRETSETENILCTNLNLPAKVPRGPTSDPAHNRVVVENHQLA